MPRIALLLCLLLVFPALAQPTTQSSDSNLREVTKQIIDRTNAFRKEQKLPAVAPEEKLTATATDFAKFMADTGKYGHDADGKQPHERAEAHKYDYCMVLENIAYQYNSEGIAQEDLIDFFVDGWKNSPGHRKNMLDADITQTGVAVVRAANGYYYAVQMFGRPKSAMIRFEIINNIDRAFEYTIAEQTFTIQPRQVRSYGFCRASKISIILPGESAPKTLTPANGDQFVFRKIGGSRYDLVKAK